MKYALIGCGRIATNHIKAVLNNHLEFAAACDVNPEILRPCWRAWSGEGQLHCTLHGL